MNPKSGRDRVYHQGIVAFTCCGLDFYFGDEWERSPQGYMTLIGFC